MEKKNKQEETVQGDWMGTTTEKENKQEDFVVVKELSCSFD